DGERHRDREVPPEPSARLPHRRSVRRAHRIHFPTGDRRMTKHRTCITSAPAHPLAATVARSGSTRAPEYARHKSPLHLGDITFASCSLSAVGAQAVEAQCATFAVPEDHDAPDGRQIELAIAVLPAETQAEPDPIVMIAGGPGQSALESYPMLAPAFA